MNPLHSAHFFAGCGGDICGLRMAGWQPQFAVEVNKHRCRTLRANHPQITVFEGQIQTLLLENYPSQCPVFFITFPCDKYTEAANIHHEQTGDSLYLEALREIVLNYPEVVILENVYGLKKFKRVMQTFQCLPLYHCTEFLLYGEDFTHQKKKRVFLILHRQPYVFPTLETYRLPKPGAILKDYLELDTPFRDIPPYVYTRLEGGYRDLPIIYHPNQIEAVNLFTNYARDRSLFLVHDQRAPRGLRPFTVRETANLHGFPKDYQFLGPLGETYDMVVDSVMPLMAYAIGKAISAYFSSLHHLAEVPQALGYREVKSDRQKEEELEQALHIVAEPEPIHPHLTEQLILWN